MTFIIALITGSHALKGSVLGSNNMTSMQLILENIAMATGHLGRVRYIYTLTLRASKSMKHLFLSFFVVVILSSRFLFGSAWNILEFTDEPQAKKMAWFLGTVSHLL